MEVIVSKTIDCSRFRGQVVHFQADELTEADRAGFEEHLSACPPCARRLEVEESMLRGLRARLTSQAVPPGLETRIRAGLAQAAGDGRAAPRWFRRPAVALAAAALLLVLFLLPLGSGRQTPAASPTLAGAAIAVQDELLVVDLQCDRRGASFAEQRNCRHPGHFNVLRLEKGTYWNIGLDSPAGRELFVEPQIRGHRMLVRGSYYEQINTLQVESHQDLGLVALRSL